MNSSYWNDYNDTTTTTFKSLCRLVVCICIRFCQETQPASTQSVNTCLRCFLSRQLSLRQRNIKFAQKSIIDTLNSGDTMTIYPTRLNCPVPHPIHKATNTHYLILSCQRCSNWWWLRSKLQLAKIEIWFVHWTMRWMCMWVCVFVFQLRLDRIRLEQFRITPWILWHACMHACTCVYIWLLFDLLLIGLI